MKQLIVGMILFRGCIGSGNSTVRDFVPGVYVCPIRQAYSTGSDTLEISLLHGNDYAIVKKSGFQRIVNGKLKAPEHISKQWTGVYDEHAQQLVEQQHGKIFSFDAKNGLLYSGSSVYRKLP